MIGPDDYPVYNHRERPGIGRDHSGGTYFNCFSIHLEQDEETADYYAPYLFTDFIRQYDQYTNHLATCDSCISEHKVFTFRADGIDLDRSAVEKKFSVDSVDESDYYYCPLISEVLLASELRTEPVSASHDDLPAQPIRAILGGNWDDDYLFEFQSIGSPKQMQVCAIYQEIISSRFVSTPSERSFLEMWLWSMFHCLELVRQSGRRTYLEDADFNQFQSKILGFLLPVPQAWVQVIPKPPPGFDWREWENLHQQGQLPQRVDFLLTYRGRRHIIELDDISHYAQRSARSAWTPSEAQYRLTLSGSRLLRRCGFEAHRFTNEEILELHDPDSPGTPDVKGFIRLLLSEGLEPAHTVLFEPGIGRAADGSRFTP